MDKTRRQRLVSWTQRPLRPAPGGPRSGDLASPAAREEGWLTPALCAGIAVVVLLLALGSPAPAGAAGYQRNVGLLPEKKAEADAGRMAEIIKRFQTERLKGKCVNSFDRQGLGRLYDLKDEEGRGTNPPRSGYEGEFYKRLKEALARGETLDPERMLELGLEASLDKNGEVNLQDVYLTIHNVVRLLARPETWWTDHNYSRGVVYDLPVLGGGEITRGQWLPGWRGMKNDSIFPIIKDIFGHEPIEGAGSGKKSLAELTGSLFKTNDPEQIRKRQENLKKKMDTRRAQQAAVQKELDQEKDAGKRALLQQQLTLITAEVNEPDLSANVPNPKYTSNLFDVPREDGSGGGLFKPLYGALDDAGNGGSYYYFWLGALGRAYAGAGAQAGGAQYEKLQKWMGSEEEYARGLIQVSHFNGGGAFGALANQTSADCAQAKKPPEPIKSGTPQLTPPPPSAEKQNDDFLNCLCRYCGGSMGGYFTKDPKSECNGGCTCWGPLSGWCTPVPTGAKICKECYAGAFGVTAPGEDAVQKGIEIARGMNRKALEESIRKLLGEKKLDEAIGVAERAMKADPGLTSPAFGQLSTHAKKAGWDDVNHRDFPSAIRRLEQAVKLNPADQDAGKKLSDAKRFASVWPQVEAKAKEFDTQMGEKKVWSAQKTMLQMQDLQFEMSGGMSNPLSKRVMDDFNKGIQEYNAFWAENSARHTKYFKEQNWEAMLQTAEEARRRELHPASQNDVTYRIQLAQTMLGQQKSAMDYYTQTKTTFAQGKIPDIPATAKELRNKTAYFTPQDPRHQQILDLAAAMDKRQREIQAKAYAVSFFNNGDHSYREYQYAEAGRSFAEGLKAIRDNGDMGDPDYAKYYKLWQDALAKDQRINQLMPGVAQMAMDQAIAPKATLDKAVAEADEILKLQPNSQNAQIYRNRLLWKLQELKAQEEKAARARQLRAEGEQLQGQHRLPEAVAKYRESLGLVPDPELARHVQTLEGGIAKGRQLRAQGEAQQREGKIAEAIASYRQSLTLIPDKALEEHVRVLEAGLASAAQKQATADRLWQEGTAFYGQGRLNDALPRFKESLQYGADPQRTRYVQELEGRRSQAQALRDEGARLQAQNRLPEAIARYKDSLGRWPDSDLEKHVRQLEAGLASTQAAKPKPPAAIVGIWSVGAIANGQQQPPHSVPWVFHENGTVEAKGLWQGTWRAVGDAIGMEMTHMGRTSRFTVVLGADGYTFTGYENGVPFRHGRLVLTAASPSQPAPPPTTPGAGQGGRAYTSVPRAPQPAQWTGTWKSENRADGDLVFVLTQTGSRVTGTYRADIPVRTTTGGKDKWSVTGAIDGTVSGARLTGSFRDSGDPKPTGSLECTMQSDGNSIAVTVHSEGDTERWTARRAGGSATATGTATVAAEITNRSRTNTHIFADGESAGPGNRFAPGETRRVPVTLQAKGAVTFTAGRDGQVLATKTWHGDPGSPSRVPVVIFDDSNPYEKLTVSTGLR